MRCGSGRKRPSRASEPFRHIPISLSGDVVRNVSYNYPFQLGFAIYGYPETVTIRNITDFASNVYASYYIVNFRKSNFYT